MVVQVLQIKLRQNYDGRFETFKLSELSLGSEQGVSWSFIKYTLILAQGRFTLQSEKP